MNICEVQAVSREESLWGKQGETFWSQREFKEEENQLNEKMREIQR